MFSIVDIQVYVTLCSFRRLSPTHPRKFSRNCKGRCHGCKLGSTEYMQGQHVWQPVSTGNSAWPRMSQHNQMLQTFQPTSKSLKINQLNPKRWFSRRRPRLRLPTNIVSKCCRAMVDHLFRYLPLMSLDATTL